MQVVGFSPLAHGDLPVLENKVLAAIANAHDKSVPQVVMRWLLQEEIVSPDVHGCQCGGGCKHSPVHDGTVS
jgi:diketogulonate reductase-like aldo/keto reductase